MHYESELVPSRQLKVIHGSLIGPMDPQLRTQLRLNPSIYQFISSGVR